MRNNRAIFMALALLLTLVAVDSPQAAEPQSAPQVITYQGYMQKADNTPVDGTRQITFTIYEAPIGGGSFWSSGELTVQVTKGTFYVNIGESPQPAFPENLWNGQIRYLGIQVTGDPEMSPRVQLASVPYAIHVGDYLPLAGGDMTGPITSGILAPIQMGSAAFGMSNVTTGVYALASGIRNAASGGSAASVAGQDNSATGSLSAVIGGEYNQATSYGSGVLGAWYCTNNGNYSAIAGGKDNVLDGTHNFIGGGAENFLHSDVCAILGGYKNQAGDYWLDSGSTVLGGISNKALGKATTVASGRDNSVDGVCSFIGGGSANIADDSSSMVGGGANNYARAKYSFIGGGGGSNIADSNSATGILAFIGGGARNSATGGRSTISGGYLNLVSGDAATVAGGNRCKATANNATVVGGYQNEATGQQATVVGGDHNLAGGMISLAAGRRAQAIHAGAFVWGDATDADVSSSGNNQFVARASGGVTFYSNSTLTAGVQLAPGGGSWSSISDRNMKTGFTPVDGHRLLEKLAALDLSTWSYKSQDASIRHIGPMAQDFYAAFGVGEDSLHITSIDADGIALAAIKELITKTNTLSQENTQLKAKLESLASELASLKAGK